jgi:nitrate reductase molybdenum cofactor assembly chaperone NarJ/NarW
MLRRHRHPAPRLDAHAVATTWQLVSVLLDYPSEALLERRQLLGEAAASLPPEVRDPLTRFLGGLDPASADELQCEYVETFDLTRRCCLYLTYFAHGDTRKRGLALVQFKQAYRKAGVELDDRELPDHLSVVLEFGAAYDADVAWSLLNDHRAGVEMLRIALASMGSRWHDVVLALLATLPQLKGDDEEKVAALIAQGPPAEEVGLEGYALDPRLNPRPSESVDLGATIRVGAR